MADLPHPQTIALPHWNEEIIHTRFSPDGTMLAIAYASGSMRIFTWPSRELLFHTQGYCTNTGMHAIGPAGGSMCWSEYPQRLYYIREEPKSLIRYIHEVRLNRPWYAFWQSTSRDVYRDYMLTHMAVDRLATRITASRNRNETELITLAVGKQSARLIATTQMHGRIRCITYSPENHRMLCVETKLMLWKREHEVPVVLHTEENVANGVACSRDSMSLAAVFGNNVIYVHNIRTDENIQHKIPNSLLHNSHLLNVAFSPNGSLLAAGSRDTLLIVRHDNLEPVIGYTHTQLEVSIECDHVEFSPCGRYLSTGKRTMLDFGNPNVGLKHPDTRMFSEEHTQNI